MMTVDPVDAIMHVMRQAFEPAFGEAWTRRQIADSLLLPNTHYLLADPRLPEISSDPHEANGFALSRHVLDEEELLLIAVIPNERGRGIGRRLLEDLCENARNRGSKRLFLEMRDGNEAEKLYKQFGFQEIGRRPGYYRGAKHGPIDAITFAKSL